MKNKIITIMIITLFFGLVILPSISSDSIKNTNDSDENLFDKEINLWLKIGHIPSLSACIIENSSVVWYKGYGYYDLFKKSVPTKDTVYLAGSISKLVTATAIMQLYEQGKFNLDDDVNNYLNFSVRNPNYPEIPITFRILLSHQCGLEEFDFIQTVNNVKDAIFNVDEYPYPLIKKILTVNDTIFHKSPWLNINPGDEYVYSNYNYILLQHLLEVITGQSLEEYCQKNIFQPLEMSNTSFLVSGFNKNQLAVPYIHILSRFYIRIPQFSGEGAAGYGGLRTSVNDLSKFFIAHMNSGICNNVRILNESTINEMHAIRYPKSGYKSKIMYGLGWRYCVVNGNLVLEGHSGNVPGGTAIMYENKSTNSGFIFFFNRQETLVKRPISSKAFDEICELFLERVLDYKIP